MAGILLLTLLRSQLQRFTSGFSRAIAVKPITFARRYFEAMRANAGAVTSMNNEWIANLAQDIKQKSHEAAEEYGRSQHRAGIVATEGRPFFTAFALCLEEDLNE